MTAAPLPTTPFGYTKTKCTTADGWLTETCGLTSRAIGKAYSGTIWTDTNVGTDLVSPGVEYPQVKLFEGWHEFGPPAVNEQRTCFAKAKLPDDFSMAAGSCESAAWLKHPIAVTASRPWSTSNGAGAFTVNLFRKNNWSELVYCVMCEDANGTPVWSNPFMVGTEGNKFWDNNPATNPYTDRTFPNVVSTHVFVLNTGVANQYSLTILVQPNYILVNRFSSYEFGPVSKCKFEVGTPPFVVGSTEAIGYDDTVVLTVDTTNVVQPAQLTYLNCIALKGQTWDTAQVLKIPVEIEIQAVPDCSTGWFTFTTQMTSYSQPAYTELHTTVDEPLSNYTCPPCASVALLTNQYVAWNIDICSPLSALVYKFDANDTVVDQNDFTFPILTFMGSTVTDSNTGQLRNTTNIVYPSQQYGMRFNASIYWEFEVITPSGNVIIQSNRWMVKVCHDQLAVYHNPLPNPWLAKLNKGGEVSLKLIDKPWTQDDACRIERGEVYETDGVTMRDPMMWVYDNMFNLIRIKDPAFLLTVQPHVLKFKLYFNGNSFLWHTTNDMFNQIITLQFYCDLDSAIIGPIQTDFYQRKEANLGTTNFLLRPTSYATNLINCPVQSVEVVNFPQNVTHPLVSQQDVNNFIIPNDIVTETVIEFYLNVRDINGTYKVGPMSLDIGCTQVGTVYSPAPGMLANAMKHLQSVIWTIPVISLNVSAALYPWCIERENTFVNLTSNITMTVPIIQWEPATIQPFRTMVIDTTLVDPAPPVNETFTISFNIQTKLSPQVTRESALFTLPICHVDSTFIYELGYPNGLGILQIVPDASIASPMTIFTTKRYWSEHPDCPLAAFMLSEDNISYDLTIPGVMNAAQEVIGGGGEWKIRPYDAYTHKEYIFYLQVYARGGRMVFDNIQYTLVIGCLLQYTVPRPNPFFIESLEYLPRDIMKYDVKFPDMEPYWWCQVQKVEPIEVEVHHFNQDVLPTPMDAFIIDQCTQPCQAFDLIEEAKKPNTTTTFKIKFYIGQNMTYESVKVNITVGDCQKNSTELIDMVQGSKKYTIPKNSLDNKVTLPNFFCTYQDCCLGMVTGTTAQDLKLLNFEEDKIANYSLVIVDQVIWDPQYKIILQVPTDQRRTMAFQLYQMNMLGVWAQSPWIYIEIFAEPYKDPYYEFELRKRVDGVPNNDQSGLNQTFNGSSEVGLNNQNQIIEDYSKSKEESLEILEDFSKFNKLPFDFMYFWENGQLSADKYKYIPDGFEEEEFMGKTEFSGRIQKVDNGGKVRIKFSHPLRDQNTGVLPASLDSTVLFVTVIPSEKTLQHLDAQGKSPEEMLNITQWNCTSFLLDTLELRVQFTNPLEISTQADREWLQIVVLDVEKFTDKAGNMRLAKNSTRMVFPIPQQMSNDPFAQFLTQSEDTVTSGMNIAAVAQISLNMVISVGLSQLLGMMQSLNIMCFSLMIKVQPPPNKQFIVGIFVGILSAEAIDPSWSTELVFEFEPDEVYIHEMLVNDKLDNTSLSINIYDLGFETFNPILNSGGMYVVFNFAVGMMAVIIIISLVTKIFKPILKLFKKSIQNEGGVTVSGTDRGAYATIEPQLNEPPVITTKPRVNPQANRRKFKPQPEDKPDAITRKSKPQPEDKPDAKRRKSMPLLEDKPDANTRKSKPQPEDKPDAKRRKSMPLLENKPDANTRKSKSQPEDMTETNNRETKSKLDEEPEVNPKQKKERSSCQKVQQRIKRYYRQTKNELFFSIPIMLILEQVFQVAVTSVLFYYTPQGLANNQKELNGFTYNAGMGFVYILAFGGFFILPILMMIMPFLKWRNLREVKSNKHWFRNYFLSIYDEINVQKRINKWFPFLSHARKMAMVYIAMLSPLPLSLQLIMLFYLNLYALIFVGNNRPYMTGFKNKVMIFNEGCVCLMTLSMVLETDFCSDLDTRYRSGFMYVSFMFLNVAINLYLMFKPTIRKFQLVFMWIWSRIKWVLFKILYCLYPETLVMSVKETAKRKQKQIQDFKEKRKEQIEQAKINTLKMEELKQMTKMERHFVQPLEKFEDKLKTKQQEVFKLDRQFAMEMMRAEVLKNITKSPQINLNLLKKLTGLKDEEKCRFIFEYSAMLQLKSEWKFVAANVISLESQKKSFSSYFKMWLEDSKRDLMEENSEAFNGSNLKNLGLVTKYMVNKEAIKDQEEDWVFKELSAHWLFKVDYTDEEIEDFVERELQITKDQVGDLYTKYEERLNVDKFGQRYVKPDERITVKQLWKNYVFARVQNLDERQRFMRNALKDEEVVTSSFEAHKNFLAERFEQLYSLLLLQCDQHISKLKAQRRSKGMVMGTIEEIIWDKIREVSTDQLLHK